MSQPLGSHYLDEARRQFRGYKRLAEGAIAQLKDEELFITLDPEANSIAVIMQHIAGNMRSRFTDFLTTDGEKPDRQRDQEFEMNADATRAEVLRRWEEGWTCVFSAIEALKPKDVMRTVTIRGEPHTVLQALNRPPRHRDSTRLLLSKRDMPASTAAVRHRHALRHESSLDRGFDKSLPVKVSEP